MHDGHKISQSMIFPHDHTDFPNEPKGIKVVLTERRLFQPKLHGKCQNKCDGDKDACCNRRILKLQPDFHDQKSLVQEVIEAAGHLCIFLPKFHCELNFIEFFWGAMKKYLRDNCDFTFATLRENMPKAHLSSSAQSVYGNIACTGGWRLTGQVWALQKLKCRSRNSVHTSTSPTDVFQTE